jgi:hypothetical protein
METKQCTSKEKISKRCLPNFDLNSKRCKICKEVKLLFNFKQSDSRWFKKGCQDTCKNCIPKLNEAKRVKNPTKRTKYNKEYVIEGLRTCVSCGLTQDKKLFPIRYNKNGTILCVATRCESCYNEKLVEKFNKLRANYNRYEGTEARRRRAEKDRLELNDSYIKKLNRKHWNSSDSFPIELLESIKALISLKRLIKSMK